VKRKPVPTSSYPVLSCSFPQAMTALQLNKRSHLHRRQQITTYCRRPLGGEQCLQKSPKHHPEKRYRSAVALIDTSRKRRKRRLQKGCLRIVISVPNPRKTGWGTTL